MNQPIDTFSPVPGGTALSRARAVPSDAITPASRDYGVCPGCDRRHTPSTDCDGRPLASEPVAPYVEGSRTSKRAAEQIEPRRQSLKERIYTFVLSQGEKGATRKEISARTGITENTVRPRVKELMAETDIAFRCPRLYEMQHVTRVREGCAVLYAGIFARGAYDWDMKAAAGEGA